MADLSQGLRETVGLEISSLEKQDQVLKNTNSSGTQMDKGYKPNTEVGR